FFAFGLALFARQQELFALYWRRWGTFALAGVACFAVGSGLWAHRADAFPIAYAHHSATWLWSFAWVRLALRVLESRRAALAGGGRGWGGWPPGRTGCSWWTCR